MPWTVRPVVALLAVAGMLPMLSWAQTSTSTNETVVGADATRSAAPTSTTQVQATASVAQE